ncbi:hypothetical protein E3N88_08068 [Mikania micrantha]|uniref:NADH:quinone oxidoreductase/Mrp antiporter transmembrane domain-containing protein n=1 Tax=Mikania micrantha TaxID=192012 RepID=A0A5N6PHA1_9ASTR|nr:hypothetical protein E3N88_08068 [Mikania micrantha]
MELHCNKSSFTSSIASMILGALAAMAQTKVKRLLAHSSIGHVDYIRTGFSCGTIEGIQSLLIVTFIYASMTIDAFAIVSALRQRHVKYIADLGALAKTNPISAITFSITMFSYAEIPTKLTRRSFLLAQQGGALLHHRQMRGSVDFD